ncbi:MAG: DapH/DapD/GlmU-related protein [Alphaproteobacteria bacterium]|nr:DapH/DapD/GlmU-related protein [Alphaproteobacteria bacterium]
MENQEALRKKHLENGVKFVDANTVYLRSDTEIASGVLIEPFVVFGEGVKLSKGCVVKSFSYIEKATLAENVQIGPFARTRGECSLGENTRVGNFVEIVRSTLGSKVSVDHLSYIGDSTFGNEVEVGAGLITCNYNGFEKNKCEVGDGAFIGSRSTLIAPVKVSENAMIGAGTVLTEDVEPEEFVIARPQLVRKKEGATRYRQKKADRIQGK